MRSRLPPLRVLLVVAAVAVAAYAAVRLVRAELVDFSVPRVAATRFLAHEPLYRSEDGHYQFKYLPAFAALMVPFAWPSKTVAEALWFILMVYMAWAFFRLALDALPDRRMPSAPLVWVTLLLNTKFFVKELGFGQFNLPLGLLLLGAVLAARDGRRSLAGALIGAGVFVKPYALVLLPWLVWTQGLRPLLPFGLVIAAGLAMPIVSYGWDGNLALLRDWYRTVTVTIAPNLLGFENVSFLSFWARWLGPGERASLFALASAVTAIAAGLALTWRRTRVSEPNYLEGAFFFIFVPLLSPQGWDYVLLLALPAYMCLVDRWRDTPRLWRVVVLLGFFLTSFAVYDVMRRTLYFYLMARGVSTIGAVLLAVSLIRLRWRALA